MLDNASPYTKLTDTCLFLDVLSSTAQHFDRVVKLQTCQQLWGFLMGIVLLSGMEQAA